jgi:hypothetical protein
VDRDSIETRVDELREANPGRNEFIAAIQEFAATLTREDREVLGQVLLERQPETGGFDALERRIAEGGWLRRTGRKIEDSLESLERRPPR